MRKEPAVPGQAPSRTCPLHPLADRQGQVARLAAANDPERRLLADPVGAEQVAQLARVADDLDTPGAVATVDTAIAAGSACTPELADLVDALLGIRLA